ncbi:MAG: FAD:protein FMN transferase [Candidatus Dormibacteraeota bacterium]|nr:FAD:protein FMN transferase [Candidatus Dormibacteraeota bacterium]
MSRPSDGVAIADGMALGGATRLVVTVPEGLAAASAAVEATLRSVDLAYSRFRPDSELSVVNSNPGRTHQLSPLLATAIAAALRAARLTGGAVDPTVGSAMRSVGYDITFTEVAPSGPALNLVARPIAGWQLVRFKERERTVLLPDGVELDLGATGKGLAADLAAVAALAAAGPGAGILVSLGGDIATAGEAPAGGWVVQVGEDSRAPVSPEAEAISIASGALATSSTTVRRWVRGEAVLHHILDPRTGLPADGPWRTATTVAASCVDANLAATAAIVKGREAEAWLAGTGVAARLVGKNGTVLRVGGWPEAAGR